MCNVVTIVNNAVLNIWKLLRVDLTSSHQGKEIATSPAYPSIQIEHAEDEGISGGGINVNMVL